MTVPKPFTDVELRRGLRWDSDGDVDFPEFCDRIMVTFGRLMRERDEAMRVIKVLARYAPDEVKNALANEPPDEWGLRNRSSIKVKP